MAKDLWRDEEAQAFAEASGPDPADQALALRVYTSRLIGSDPDLVMHGGGNTSVKVRRRDLFGEEIDVLHVKGSGSDLGTIEAAGLPGVRLAPLLRLRALERLSDEDMVNVQRTNLLDSSSPNPSVETLLHAFLPHAYIDHTHATAMLALADLPDAEAAAREIFGARVAIAPYVMPGFALAKAAAKAFERDPSVEGLLLLNHGHFTFGADARESYKRMIAQVGAVEAWFAARRREPSPAPAARRDPAPVLATLRGALVEASGGGRDAPMPALDLRASEGVLSFLARPDLEALSRRGVATPDHVIRTKAFPLLVAADDAADPARARDKVARFADDYRAYFARQNARAGGGRTRLAAAPSLLWIPGVGIAGVGADAAAARIAADLGEQTQRVIDMSEHLGPGGARGFQPIGEDDLFDTEYWSLEQAKLGKSAPPPLRGRIVMVTGGAGAIGKAIAAAFKSEGANVFLVDRDGPALEAAARALGRDHDCCVADVTAAGAPAETVAGCVRRFGGLDILVNNAGTAITGDIATLDDAALRQSFELNFFAARNFAKAAAAVFRAQGRGGQLLFNVSKQAVNPGKGFGAYGLPKAATFFLVKQLALELGAEGVRANGVNADRIRSGLLTEAFIAERAAARGTTPENYMAGNLLRREVEARHVADAFVALALAERTTGHVMTVDGGNVEASLR